MSTTPELDEQDETFDPPPWHLLREARESRGLSILDVASHLKLAPKQIDAIEAGELHLLPGQAFARGFVRNYARFLGLDVEAFLLPITPAREAPAAGYVEAPAKPLAILPEGRSLWQRWQYSALPVMLVSAGLFGLIFAGWHFKWFESRDEQLLRELLAQSAVIAEVASAPAAASAPSAPSTAIILAPEPLNFSSAPMATASAPDAAPDAAPAANASSPSALASAPSAAPVVPTVPAGQRLLHFSFDGDAWVQVRDASGKTLHSQLNLNGSQLDVVGKAPFSLTVGNAAKVKLSLDGQATELRLSPGSTVAKMQVPPQPYKPKPKAVDKVENSPLNTTQ